MGSEPPVPARSTWKLGITDKTTSSIPVQQQTYLGAREVKQVPFAQGTINPRVKNMTQRLINLDSQYRSMPGGVSYKYPTPGCSTNYSVTLSESLKNSMSITLNSYEIPYSWVGIDPLRGNNKLVVSFHKESKMCSSCLTFSAGNWSLDYINHILSIGPDWPSSSTLIPDVGYWTPHDENICASASSTVFGLSLSVNKDGFVTITTTNNPTSANPLVIHFWGPEVDKNCSHGCSAVSTNYQSSLGWLLGFRTQSVTFPFEAPYTITAPAHSVWATQNGWLGPSSDTSTSCDIPAPPTTPLSISLSCWKMTQYIPYLYVVLEDHNKNHNNKGVLNIIPAATVLNMPSYAKPTGMKKYDPDGKLTVGVCESSESKLGDEVQPSYYNGEVVGGIYPDPQHLTQAQLYTIAAIKNNRTFRSPYSIPTGPSDSDILAKITLPSLDFSKFGKFIPENSGSLQVNSRAYFGPVDLDRFTIKLIDNNGNLVNLNNRDWSFTLRVEQLYQY